MAAMQGRQSSTTDRTTSHSSPLNAGTSVRVIDVLNLVGGDESFESLSVSHKFKGFVVDWDSDPGWLFGAGTKAAHTAVITS